MIKWLDDFAITYGKLSGLSKDLFVSAVFVLMILLSVIVVGILINKLEILEFRMIYSVFGQKFAHIFCNYVTFPGVVIHELSHAFMAFLVGGIVHKIHLLEFRNDGRLGYVEFATRGTKLKQMFQSSAISCAPVLFGYVWVYFLLRLLLNHQFEPQVIVVLIYILFSVIHHISMSRQDIKVYLKGGMLLFPFMTMIMLVIKCWFFKF